MARFIDQRDWPAAIGSVVLALIVAACSSAGATVAPSIAPTAASAPAASAASGIMAKGTFHDVVGSATGAAQLVVTPAGAYEVALESFMIGSIDHTDVVLVANDAVNATADIDKTKLLDLGPLKATEGMQDFPIPAAMASGVMTGYHSVVLWDTAMAHAIAAASLK